MFNPINKRGRPSVDLTGWTFGRLKVVELVQKRKWRCSCACGGEKVVIQTNLVNGNTKSCGCLQSEVAARHIAQFKTTKPAGQAYLNSYLRCMRYAAARRGLVFDLSTTDLMTLVNAPCAYCGGQPKMPPATKSSRHYNGLYPHNGIDRKDNRLGYIKANCVSACWTCNRAKAGLSYEDFAAWIRQIHSHLHLCKTNTLKNK